MNHIDELIRIRAESPSCAYEAETFRRMGNGDHWKDAELIRTPLTHLDSLLPIGSRHRWLLWIAEEMGSDSRITRYSFLARARQFGGMSISADFEAYCGRAADARTTEVRVSICHDAFAQNTESKKEERDRKFAELWEKAGYQFQAPRFTVDHATAPNLLYDFPVTFDPYYGCYVATLESPQITKENIAAAFQETHLQMNKLLADASKILVLEERL